MNKLKGILLGLTALTFSVSCPITWAAEKATPFSAQKKQEIEQIVHDYLLANPEILIKVSQEIQRKQAQLGIEKGAKDLFTADGSPTTGDKDSNLNLVEFFDYQCPHCKNMDLFVQDLTKANPKLRVVFKELPIFGEASQLASTAALASQKQGKYMAFHHALLQSKSKLDETKIMDIARSVGIDVDLLRKDMEDKAITQELKNNVLLAQRLGLRGTPAFIVGRYPAVGNQDYGFVPGATSKETLQRLIDAAK
jgi:protein-disulfide isomerase